jgi:hypothetical protein
VNHAPPHGLPGKYARFTGGTEGVGEGEEDRGEILLTEEVRDRAAGLSGVLRTLGAVHVAGALALGDGLQCLDVTYGKRMVVTYDKRMPEAASAAVLPAYAPGMTDRARRAPAARRL